MPEPFIETVKPEEIDFAIERVAFDHQDKGFPCDKFMDATEQSVQFIPNMMLGIVSHDGLMSQSPLYRHFFGMGMEIAAAILTERLAHEAGIQELNRLAALPDPRDLREIQHFLEEEEFPLG